MAALHGMEKIILLNSDLPAAVKELEKQPAYAITYGLNSKATLTLSSLKEGQMVLCLQRTIVTLDGVEVEPQEFTVSCIREHDPQTVMLLVCACLACGVPIEKLSRILF